MISECVLNIGRLAVTLGCQATRHLPNTSTSTANDVHPLVALNLARHRVHVGYALRLDFLWLCLLAGFTWSRDSQDEGTQSTCEHDA